MKRNSGVLLLVSLVLFLGLLLIPTSKAERREVSKEFAENPEALEGPNSRHAGLASRQSDALQGKDRIHPLAAGQPNILNSQSALSAAIITTLGGRDTQFSEVSLLANWDGREDNAADRSQKIDDFSFVEADVDFLLTRSAISEHTYANGFNENVFYYGDSVGNFWVGTDTNPAINPTPNGSVDSLRQVNIPELVRTGASGGVTLLNPTAGDCTDDQIVVTGIAVNPVADLGDFGAANCGVIGEVVYVSILDTGGCSSSASGQIFRSRILAFGFKDGNAAAAATPVGAIQLLRNQFSNSGIAVDDDGSLYFHLVDNIQFLNGAIFKVTETPRSPAGCAVVPRVNRVVASIPSGLNGGISLTTAQGTTGSPILVASGMRLTNYSGPSRTFGNVVALAAGPKNVVYAAVARSLVQSDDPFTQLTEGLFVNPPALGATPSMIISFADVRGGFNACDSPAPGVTGPIPVADGFADPALGTTTTAGVNNFRVFALGNGPTIGTAGTGLGLLPSTLKLDMQIDPGLYNGLTVDEEGTVYVISGGTPAGIGRNPSPITGEILAFQDTVPADRRADFVDLRGDSPPNPPASGGNVGDGDSDRFDHIFAQAPIDATTGTPTGISGLARGFLLYTNRTRNRNVGSLANLPNGDTQGDDSTTTGALVFEDFDEGHQVAGGDDQNTPFRGDDSDGAGNLSLVGPLRGGFEFSFGGPVGTASCVWNSFFLNSNGNITFGAGDTDNTPTVTELRAGLPKIAPAWADLNPAARAATPVSFPVQALGFVNVNAFKVRWINVAEFGSELCVGSTLGSATNSFAVTLSDDGIGIDENSSQPLNPANPIGNNAVPFDLQEGPTDQHWVQPQPSVLVGENPRRDGTGQFVDEYGRMDFIGTLDRPVLAGYSVGGLAVSNPPGLCESNMGQASLASDTTFGVLPDLQNSSIQPGLIGEGTEPTIFEFFNEGTPASLGGGGEVILATPSFDLRFEGNDPTASTPPRQTDLNRGQVGYYGVSCAPPPNPAVAALLPGQFVATPSTPVILLPGSVTGTNLINAIGAVELNVVGNGFFPNEATTICQNDMSGGIPTPRPGKTVTTAMTFGLDTNGDSVVDLTFALTGVVVISRNLVRGTFTPLPTALGTAFPFAANGGIGQATVNTTFTAGDNNIFGPFIRSALGLINTGLRAPVVLSVTSSEGDCGVSQDLLISGSDFQYTAAGIGLGGSNVNATVTDVFAVDASNAGNVIHATTFTVLTANQVTARFDFGAINAGKRFLIYVTGTGGTSRNLTSLPAGAPAGSPPIGNEQGVQVSFSCQVPPPIVPDTFQFSMSNVNITEDCTVANVTVSRLNPTAGTATVDYATNDVSATQRSDYEIALGTLTFGPGETSKTIPILINEDGFVEGNETLSVLLTNPSGAISGGLSTVTIVDDDLVPGANPLDNASNFVCQQYHDFLNREPDAPGLTFWTTEIMSCGADAACIAMKRQNVSAAFFLSGEFQETGGNVIRTQRVAFGRKSNDPVTRYVYQSFMHDAQQVGRGVVIGAPGADALLEANKQAYATQIVTSAAFIISFPLIQTGPQYVAALFTSAGVVPTGAETTAALTAFGAGGTAGRVAALRSVADANSVRQAELNGAFVLLEYYGYLRRNPTDPPDGNDSGYQFWLGKLNMAGGNFINADMVQSFLVSGEYRARFGTP